MEPLFHLPIPVDDLDLAKKFYIGTIGCTVGRAAVKSNGNTPPLRHFGVILALEDWQEMKRRLAPGRRILVISAYLVCGQDR